MDARVLRLVTLLSLCGCGEPRVVLLASDEALLEGTELQPSHLVEVKAPASLATANAVRPSGVAALLGKRLRVPLQKGDLLLSSYLEQNAELADLVQKRARGVTLSVSGAENVHSGDHVDLLALLLDPQTNDWTTTTQAQNVIVLSPGVPVPGTTEAFPLRRVTFLLLSEEAETALLAVRLGGLHVSLRNPDDIDVMEDRGRASVNTLLSGERRRILEQRRRNLLSLGTPPASPQANDIAPVPTLPGVQP
jgi:pilus assembly protein CpaB